MKFTLILLCISMYIFDLLVLAGTVYLICYQNWSAWWMLLATLIIGASSPRRLILAAHGIDADPN